MKRAEREGKPVGIGDGALTGAEAAQQTRDAILQFVGRALSNETKTLTDDDAHWLRQSIVWLRQSFKTLTGIAELFQESDPEKACIAYNSIYQMMVAAFDAGIFGGVSKSGAKYVLDFGARKARDAREELPKGSRFVTRLQSCMEPATALALEHGELDTRQGQRAPESREL